MLPERWRWSRGEVGIAGGIVLHRLVDGGGDARVFGGLHFELAAPEGVHRGLGVHEGGLVGFGFRVHPCGRPDGLVARDVISASSQGGFLGVERGLEGGELGELGRPEAVAEIALHLVHVDIERHGAGGLGVCGKHRGGRERGDRQSAEQVFHWWAPEVAGTLDVRVAARKPECAVSAGRGFAIPAAMGRGVGDWGALAA